jgi:hypothetical protein
VAQQGDHLDHACGAPAVDPILPLYRIDGPRELTRPRLELLEQPDVLDGDDRLIGEGLQEFHFRVREAARLPAAHVDGADDLAFPQHRHRDQAPVPEHLSGLTREPSRVSIGRLLLVSNK